MAAATGIFRSCDLWWVLSSCSGLFEQTRPLNGSRLRPSPTAREFMLCLVELVDCDTTGLQQISRSSVLQLGHEGRLEALSSELTTCVTVALADGGT